MNELMFQKLVGPIIEGRFEQLMRERHPEMSLQKNGIGEYTDPIVQELITFFCEGGEITVDVLDRLGVFNAKL